MPTSLIFYVMNSVFYIPTSLAKLERGIWTFLPPTFSTQHPRSVRSCGALSQSGETSPDFCCFYGGGIRHNENIMHSFQNFIVSANSQPPPPPPSRNNDMEISCESAAPVIMLHGPKVFFLTQEFFEKLSRYISPVYFASHGTIGQLAKENKRFMFFMRRLR